jgi:WD40 repeat protein
VWPLSDASGERSRIIRQIEGVDTGVSRLTVAPNGSFAAFGNRKGHVGILSLDSGPVRELGSFERRVTALAVGPGSRRVAAGFARDQFLVRIWDLESGEVRTLDSDGTRGVVHLEFTSDGDLWVVTHLGVQRWSLEGDQPQILEDLVIPVAELMLNAHALGNIDLESRQAAFVEDTLSILDIDSREVRELTSHGVVQRAVLFAGGTSVVSADRSGEVRVGPVTGEEPHLLLGHEMEVNTMAVSPDGRWIATGGDDKTIRLWPMPDLTRPPLQALPREELIAKLETLTNLRAVRDEDSPTGWTIETGPFPGWETVPTW